MVDRARAFKRYWAIRRVLAPTLRYCQFLYEDVLTEHVGRTSAWLDLGCGHQILPAWRSSEERKLIDTCGLVVGIDYDLFSLQNHTTLSRRVRGDISELPFKRESFDLVTANMVVEHLDRPEDQFREVHRVLRPGGRFIFHTPNAYGHFALMRKLTPDKLKDGLMRLLDGRDPEDIFPVHYRANSRGMIDRVAEATGFDVVKTKMIVSDAIFSVFPPIAVVELLWIRLLMTAPLKPLRTNIIAILEKPVVAGR